MITHFNRMYATIHAIHRYPTLELQKQRLHSLGYPHANLVDMNEFWYECCSQEERARVDSLEWFDE